MKRPHSTAYLDLKFPKLDLASLRMLVYSDASHYNRKGNNSQLGYTILLPNKSENFAVLHFSSKKSTRVTRSSMAGDTLAFVDAFDSAFVIKHDLDQMLGVNVPLMMLTGSEQLLQVLTRSRYTTERRLMIDI